MDFSQTTPTFQEIRPKKTEQVIEIQGYPQCHPPRKYSLNKALLGHTLRFAIKEPPGKKKNNIPSLGDATTKASLILEAQQLKPYGNPVNKWKVNYLSLNW